MLPALFLLLLALSIRRSPLQTLACRGWAAWSTGHLVLDSPTTLGKLCHIDHVFVGTSSTINVGTSVRHGATTR
jgi:hypothetical protein